MKRVGVLIIDPSVDKGVNKYTNMILEDYVNKGHTVRRIQKEEHINYVPERFRKSSAVKPRYLSDSTHAVTTARHFLESAETEGVRYDLILLKQPVGYYRQEGNYKIHVSGFRRRGQSSDAFKDHFGYHLIDGVIKENPNIQIISAPYGASGGKIFHSDSELDFLNELASKDGRKILVSVAGGNEPKGRLRRSNATGYQDKELKSADAYKHHVIISQQAESGKHQDRLSLEPFAPQVQSEEAHEIGTSYTNPQLAGGIAKMVYNAVRDGSVNGNTIVPAVLLDIALDRKRNLENNPRSLTFSSHKDFFNYMKSTLNKIIMYKQRKSIYDSNLNLLKIDNINLKQKESR